MYNNNYYNFQVLYNNYNCYNIKLKMIIINYTEDLIEYNYNILYKKLVIKIINIKTIILIILILIKLK